MMSGVGVLIKKGSGEPGWAAGAAINDDWCLCYDKRAASDMINLNCYKVQAKIDWLSKALVCPSFRHPNRRSSTKRLTLVG